MASIVSDLTSATYSPDELNTYINYHTGYVDGDLMIMDSFDAMGLTLTGMYECSQRAAPLYIIQNALATGHGVVCEVDFTPGGSINQHWVRVVAISSDEADCMDPWQRPGCEMVNLLDYYGRNAGWNLERAIMLIATYKYTELSHSRGIGNYTQKRLHPWHLGKYESTDSYHILKDKCL